MATIVVKIDTVDQSDKIEWKTFVFDQAITNQIDTVTFSIKRTPTKTFKPDILADIEIIEDGTKVFGGKIVETEEVIEGQLETIRVTAKDHAHEMDSILVVDVFENTTVDAIIESIKDDFLPAGFTTTGVVATDPVDFIAFNFEQPSKVFQQLAELVGADWFVDPDKDINFFTKESESAPFDLEDNNETFIWNSLKIKRDVKNLRNTIFVRGGTFKGDSFTEDQEADGETATFVQGFRYSSIVVSLDTGTGFSVLTLGIDNIDDPSAFDVLYNFAEKAVKFPDASKPAATDILRVVGLPSIPVIIKTKDNASITEFGEFQHKIIDKSIDSKEGAREKAAGDLLLWAQSINEGRFKTRSSGLRVGQQLRINSVIRDIDEFFIITRITTRMDKPDRFLHNVTMVTQKTYGMVEFLQRQLIDKDKEIEINPDEVLDLIESAVETITFFEDTPVTSTAHNVQPEGAAFGEVPTVQALDFPVVFVYGPFPTPSGFDREGALNGAVLS